MSTWRSLCDDLRGVTFQSADWRLFALETANLRAKLGQPLPPFLGLPQEAIGVARELHETLESALSFEIPVTRLRIASEHAQQLKDWLLELIDPIIG